MKVHEIPMEREIILKLSKEGDTAEIKAVPMRAKPGAILLKPIYINNRLFTIEKDEKIHIDIIYSSGDTKPLIWRSVGFKNIVIEGVPHLTLHTDAEGAEHNRRSSFRLPMDIVGMLDNRDRVIIRDISSDGISFRTTRDVRKAVRSTVSVKLDTGSKMLELKATIVRELPMEEGYIYGCRVSGSIELDKFIADEQNKRFFRRRAQSIKK